MEWVEIPAQRVLAITHEEAELKFEKRGDEGQQCLFVRHDNRVFRLATIQPENHQQEHCIYLSEV